MNRSMMRLVPMLLVAGLARPTSAHMVFILPQADSGQVEVVFNDKLRIDERVSSDRLTSLRLVAIDKEGRKRPLGWTKQEHHLAASLPTPRPTVIGGDVLYGYARSRHTGDKPVLIKQFPKAVVGPIAAAAGLKLGDRSRYEIVPETRDGALRLRVVRSDGSPVPGASCKVTPEGDEASGTRGKTDEDGFLPDFPLAPGRIGVWAKVVEATPGEWEGKPYEEVHHYATLVFDLPPAASATGSPDNPASDSASGVGPVSR